MGGVGQKTNPVIMSRWTFDHLPTELHRVVAAEMLEAGRLVIVSDTLSITSTHKDFAKNGAEGALSGAGGA